MALHLIKMAAGIESLQALAERQAFLRERALAQTGRPELVHVTRFFPKRADEILAVGDVPGSLYWVFQRAVQVRQKIGGFREVVDEAGVTRCAIVLSGPLVPVERQRRKAFQGWRYLTGEDAPDDLSRRSAAERARADAAPAAMQAALKELCLI